MLFYLSFAALSIAIALQTAIKQDKELPIDTETWFFILLVGAIWPVTLPFILRKKLLNLSHHVRHAQLLTPRFKASAQFAKES